MPSIKTTLLLVVSLMMVKPIFASEVSLYSAQIEVQSQTSDERVAAYPAALKEILLKITENAHLLETDAAKNLITDSARLVKSYSYQKNQDDRTVLNIEFDKIPIEQFLASMNQPMWGGERPLSIIWMTLNQDNKITLISDDGGEVAQQVHLLAQTYGMPVVLPVYDLLDQKSVTTDKLNSQHMQQLVDASRRYQANAVLQVSIRNSENEWEASWCLWHDNKIRQWMSKAATQQAVIASGMQSLAKTFTSEYAFKKEEASKHDTVLMSVSKINSSQEYKALLSYLQQLAPVNTVKVTQLSSDKISLEIKINGKVELLQRVINLDHQMMPEIDTAQDGRLHYQWTS